MIANEREYRITRSEAQKFEHALRALNQRPVSPETDPLTQLSREALESDLEALRQEIRQYEALQRGEVPWMSLTSLTELPEALIGARIAAGLTQKELGERIGVRAQQIQRYEATKYETASLARILDIADALSVAVTARVTFSQQASDIVQLSTHAASEFDGLLPIARGEFGVRVSISPSVLSADRAGTVENQDALRRVASAA